MGLGSQVTEVVNDSKDFVTDSVRFLNKCTKPDKKGNLIKKNFTKLQAHVLWDS